MNKMSISSRVIIAVAAISMISVFFLPVWFIFLVAPQYPEGLEMNIWLTKITGQVEIINGLNHYIGMKKISEEMFPEFSYMYYILAAYITAGVITAIIGTRKLLFMLLMLTIILAGAALYDFYKWGYDYGHNLDPNAAIKVPGLSYQPPVVGHKTLLNFDAYSYPDTGGWVIIGAGAVFFLIYFLEWYRHRKKARKQSRMGNRSKVAAAACLSMMLISCSADPEPIQLGKDACEDCKMTIVDGQYGGEIITKKGRVYKFDDVRCLRHFVNEGKVKSQNIAQTVLLDFEEPPNFLDVKSGFIVLSPSFKSPMNSNAAAFSSKETAVRMANEYKGKLLTWNEYLAAE